MLLNQGRRCTLGWGCRIAEITTAEPGEERLENARSPGVHRNGRQWGEAESALTRYSKSKGLPSDIRVVFDGTDL